MVLQTFTCENVRKMETKNILILVWDIQQQRYICIYIYICVCVCVLSFQMNVEVEQFSDMSKI